MNQKKTDYKKIEQVITIFVTKYFSFKNIVIYKNRILAILFFRRRLT